MQIRQTVLLRQYVCVCVYICYILSTTDCIVQHNLGPFFREMRKFGPVLISSKGRLRAKTCF